MKITIKHLFEAPNHTTEVADWIYQEFWADKNELSARDLEKLLRAAKTPDQLPLSLVAMIDKKVIGTINFIINDDSDRPELTPWLAALIVKPNLRKQGIGSQLVNALLNKAKDLHIKKVYLGTDNPDFYTNLGAKKHEKKRPGFFIMYFNI